MKQKKVSVAIIGSRGYPYVYSGYETFVKEVAERLVDRDIEVTVYCHKNLFKEYPKEVKGIKLVYLYTVEKKSLAQLIHSFQAIMHACFKRYDLVLVVNPANGPFGILTRLFRVKTAINVDGLEWLRPKWKGLGAKYFYWASKMATRFYDQIINDSEEMRKVYLEEFNTPSTVIAYGANIRESKQPELIEKWQLDPQGYYLIVGRLIPDNNADLIVREFVKSDSKKKLVVVGDVPYKDEFATRIKATEDPRLVFTGYVTDQNELAELYHHCFAYFHGHQFGGTNPTMLKALAYGCAILAIDTVFSREMLDGEKHGQFFTKEEGNLGQLITKVEQQPEMLQAYREKSRDRIRENYTWEKITGQYEDLIREMAQKR